jgi:HK97 family phage major capsid protein
MDDGGIRFKEWEWMELSLVTIPANSEATITQIKSLDRELLAAKGITQSEEDRPKKPPVGVTTTKVKMHKPQEGRNMNIEEQIKGFEATRQAKAARINELMESVAEEGETLDAEQAQEYDQLEGEIKSIDDHLKRLEKMREMNKKEAKPVEDKTGMNDRVYATAKVTEKLAPGIEFARYAMCLGAAKGDLATASAIAQKRFPNAERINLVLKEAVSAGTTTDATWALPLLEYNQFAGDFVDYLRPQTLIGRFGQGGIPALRSAPFNIHIRGQTSGGEGYWVGQGAPKPLTKFDFEDIYLGFAKVANIAVLTDELVRFSNPSAEMLVRDSLAGALIARLDIDFVDPTKAEVSNVSPASITNGVTQNQASGTDADAVRTDVATMMGTFITANITPAAGVWIMSQSTALTLSLMRNALGQKEFPDITMMGGTFEGLPVLTSEHVAADSDGAFIYLVNASDIWLADDGNVVIDASREASLQMLDDPTNNSATPTPTSMVSMFQTNSVAIRAERWINWKKRRSAAVAVLAGVNYVV